jgi:hypothetical protein
MSKKLDRRSFLRRVGAAAGVGSLGLVAGCVHPRAFQTTDSDTGRYADPVGGGRGGGRGGVTDSDTGRYADPVGGGRGGGRGGVTDSDTGRYADPIGGGRGG